MVSDNNMLQRRNFTDDYHQLMGGFAEVSSAYMGGDKRRKINPEIVKFVPSALCGGFLKLII